MSCGMLGPEEKLDSNFPGQKTDQTAFALWLSGQFVKSGSQKPSISNCFFFYHELNWAHGFLLSVKRPETPKYNVNMQGS